MTITGLATGSSELILKILIGSWLVALGIFLLFIILAVYIYFAYCWKTIAKKLRYKKSWIAWIPIANIAMILHLGGFAWQWVFLILLPIIGWIPLAVLVIIAEWRIFEKRKYPGWFALSTIIPQMGTILYLIIIGFVAFADRKKKLLG